VILLDACALINLLASGEIEPILSAAASEIMICAAVEKESIYLRSDDPSDPSPALIRLDGFIRAGVFSVCDIEGEAEETLYVDYAGQLDDGEAMSLAIANARGFILATDDRKARRVFLESVRAKKRLLSTSDLIRRWAERKAVSRARIKSVLSSIQQRANFIPARSDANFAWWRDASR
jgi:predicted nucleic acid-binding protein